MTDRRLPYSRYLLVVIVLLFLAAVAWWWSLRALRIDARTAPTPAANTPAPTPAGTPPR